MYDEPYVEPPTRPRRSHPGRLLAAGVAAVVLIGIALESVPPGAPGYQLLTSVASAAAAPGPPVTAAQPPVDPQLAAIQHVIQRANGEQAQNLLVPGVTSTRRVHLAWGPITINGPTATATTYETWITTFSDSTTVQSTDINVYTLVEQAGGWIIQDDRRPSPPELQSVHFWVAVGNNDTNPADVPRQFDPFQGDDRVDRAQAFVAALGALDVSAQLAVFPGVPHALTPAMEGAAIAFLADHSAPTAG